MTFPITAPGAGFQRLLSAFVYFSEMGVSVVLFAAGMSIGLAILAGVLYQFSRAIRQGAS